MAERQDERSDALSMRAVPYPTSRLAPKFELVELAEEISRADATLAMVTTGKLELIRDQMERLRAEARRILEAAEANARLHRARCHFKKAPGKTYHLYRDGGGALYFSMLSPDDWGGSPPHTFEGSYRLEIDLGFTRTG